MLFSRQEIERPTGATRSCSPEDLWGGAQASASRGSRENRPSRGPPESETDSRTSTSGPLRFDARGAESGPHSGGPPLGLHSAIHHVLDSLGPILPIWTVCHWLCQCFSSTQEDTGKASGTPLQSQWHPCAECGSAPFGCGQRQHCLCVLCVSIFESARKNAELAEARRAAEEDGGKGQVGLPLGRSRVLRTTVLKRPLLFFHVKAEQEFLIAEEELPVHNHRMRPNRPGRFPLFGLGFQDETPFLIPALR